MLPIRPHSYSPRIIICRYVHHGRHPLSTLFGPNIDVYSRFKCNTKKNLFFFRDLKVALTTATTTTITKTTTITTKKFNNNNNKFKYNTNATTTTFFRSNNNNFNYNTNLTATADQ